MPVLAFPEYRPDASDFNGASTTVLLNVLARSDGYGPMRLPNAFTFALPAGCRGTFMARKDDRSILLFAGTSDRLYVLDNTTLAWVDISKDGLAYSALSTNANWSFAQFGSKLIAVQANVAPQVFDVEIGTEFDDLAGSPPQAAYITVINRFVVLSGLLSFPRRIQWSGLNAITTWTSGTTYSDYQDLPDGGTLSGVVGGEFGIIVQDNALRRMIFSPGSDIIFQIDRIAKDIGTSYPNSICEAGGNVYFLSDKGFVKVDAAGAITPIGFERVDRTFDRDADLAQPQLIQAAVDPSANVVLWTYKETAFSSTRFNRGLAYNTALNRWAPIEVEGEFITALGKPGVTLEGLGTVGQIEVLDTADNGSGEVRLEVADTSNLTTGMIKDVSGVTGTTEANGTWTITVVDGTHVDLDGSVFANAWVSGGAIAGSLDDLGVSLDDFSAATLNELGVFNSDHRLCYFSGDTMEATLTAAEQSGIKQRLFIRGIYPITDATTAYASIAKRESMKAVPVQSTETLINAQGMCPQRVSTRHARATLRIPEGETWTFATGVEPDFTYEGAR
jgi:phosphotransferase system IIB component